MNSDARRIQAQFDRHDPEPFPHAFPPRYYDAENLRDRVTSNPAILVPAIVLVATVLYQTAAQNGQLPPLGRVLWDALVYLLPARLLFALDGWLDPPLFPNPMLQTQTVTRSHAAKSDVLRKLLGLDRPGGIMMSVSQAGRKGLNTLSGSALGFKSAGDQPPGLGNMDNSCYQNSILQGLAALKPLPSYLAGLGLSGDGRERRLARTTDALGELISDLNDLVNNGRTLWTPGVLKNMNTWQQQDAQEYYSKLLDEIDKEIAKAAQALQRAPGFESDYHATIAKDDGASSQHSDDSGYQSISTHSKVGLDAKMVRNPLEGLTAQRVACVACGWSEGLTMTPFNCLTLSLGSHTQYDLYEGLDGYAKVEFIDGVECVKCTLKKFQHMITVIIERMRQSGKKDEDFPEPFARLKLIEEALEEDDFSDETQKKCKISPKQRVNSTKTKQTVIARPPQSLAIHINRSVFDENTGMLYKNFANVKFPTILDLGPWCLGSADRSTGFATTPENRAEETSTLEAADEEHWLLDATKSMIAGDQHPSKITGPIYELRAVVTHQGRHENGHYVCYRKHPRSKTTEDHSKGGGPDKPPQLASEHPHEHEDSDDVEDEVGSDVAENRSTAELGSQEDESSDQWWRLSDQNVYQVDEDNVLAQGGVFMLFYDCVDPNSILSSDVDHARDRGEDSKATAVEDREEIGVEELAVSLEAMADLIAESKKQEKPDNGDSQALGGSESEAHGLDEASNGDASSNEKTPDYLE